MTYRSIICGLLGAGAAALTAFAPALAQPAPQIRVGVLNCNVAGGAGFVFGSSKQLECFFESDGRRERYYGVINKFGLDVGATTGGGISWAVLATTDRIGPGALVGTYG